MGNKNVFKNSVSSSMEIHSNEMPDHQIDHTLQRYPCCIVWTPIPVLTWFFPIIGHMGIATSVGIIRDFAGPYYVSTDNMAFGKPTKYWQLNHGLAVGGTEGWDKAVTEASEIYKNRNHNLCLDNCHSHVATALNKMEYDNSSSWNMVKLALLIFIHGKYVSFAGFLKTWLPFCVIIALIMVLIFMT